MTSTKGSKYGAHAAARNRSVLSRNFRMAPVSSMTLLSLSFGRPCISRSPSPFEPIYRNGLIVLVSKLEMYSFSIARQRFFS